MRNASWIVLLSLAATPVLGEEKTIEPGLYEITTKTAAGTNTVRQCLTAKDVVAGLNPALDKGCKRVRSTIAGGKFDFATTCPDMAMTMTGTYTPTSYAIDGKVVMKDDDTPVTMESHITARRVAEACKAS